MSSKYTESGVSLERGYESIRKIKHHINATKNKGAMGEFGSFGGLFDLTKYNIPNPVLVSGTDGVGTKLLIAQAADKHDTIGIDLVAMCVNDVITLGATPLFFLDYIATGTVEPKKIDHIVSGIAQGCIQSGCALIGGETAEMPDMYINNHYDLAGYATGILDKYKIIDNAHVQENDIIIGLPSSGLHSNGYSLVRKIFFKDNSYTLEDTIPELKSTLVEELLKPTKIYVKPVLAVLEQIEVHSIAHITGGGFYENIPRALPSDLGAIIHEHTLPKYPIFTLLERLGNIEHNDMYNIFNMGIGMILIVSNTNAQPVMDILHNHQIDARIIGRVTTNQGVTIE